MSNPAVPNPFVIEVARRIGINEGCKLTRYQDTMGIWTIGIGFNLERSDAAAILRAAGANLAAIMAGGSITVDQAHQIFALCFGGIQEQARGSLAGGVFDTMTDARRFVICDLIYNMGLGGWTDFAGTRGLLSEAQQAKNAGKLDAAHAQFDVAADHLTASAWYGQVGDRAKRNVAMIRSGVWVDATGDGSAAVAA
jgi:lysozyme